MRRLALGLAVLWLCIAYASRLGDMRKPQFRVSAITGGQRHERATVAWIESAVANRGPGRLVVADLRVDGKLLGFTSRPLPSQGECRLWLEENPEKPWEQSGTSPQGAVMQAVVACPDQAPLRLTAAGTSIPGLGSDKGPPTLYSISPLMAVDPEKVVQRVHRSDLSPAHPWLFPLGLLACIPLLFSAFIEWRRARMMRQKPLLSGVLEQAGAGFMVIRSEQRRVSVYVEDGELLSVGLTEGGLSGSDAMAVNGVHATIQGEAEENGASAFREQETMRLRRGSVLIVGDVVEEARRRFLRRAQWDVSVSFLGMLAALAVSAGLLW